VNDGANPPSQPVRPVIEVLTDRERVIGANRMFTDGKDAASITEEEAKLVIQQVELYLQAKRTSKTGKPELSRKDVARALGYSAGVVSEVLNSNYKGDWRSVILDLDRWLDIQLKSDAAPAASSFIWTSVAQEIETVARLVTQLRRIGLVYGPDTPGIGKTMALQALNQVLPGSILVTVDKAHANPTGLLRALATALRLGETGKNATLYDRIVNKLSKTPRLVMVDQIHNLRFAKDDKPFYYLTDLWDRTKAPQLWCGTADLVGYLRRGKAKSDESLAQIASRVTYVRDLMQRTSSKNEGGKGEPLVTVDQVREMFAKNKVRLAADAVRFLWSLACLPESGSLRLCDNLVRIASITAEHEGFPSIDVRLIKAALKDSVQGETFATLVHQSSEFLERMSKAG
jgi:hypothetical protein